MRTVRKSPTRPPDTRPNLICMERWLSQRSSAAIRSRRMPKGPNLSSTRSRKRSTLKGMTRVDNVHPTRPTAMPNPVDSKSAPDQINAPTPIPTGWSHLCDRNTDCVGESVTARPRGPECLGRTREHSMASPTRCTRRSKEWPLARCRSPGPPP